MIRYCLIQRLDDTTIRCLKRGSETECDTLGKKLEEEHPDWYLVLVKENDLNDIIISSVDIQ